MKHGWMKHTAALICLVALAVSCLLAVAAETVDLSGLSDDEIEALLNQVQEEIISRGIEKTASLEAGCYTGGVDIPVGKYTLLCKTNAGQYGIVQLSAADDDPDGYPSLLYDFVGSDSEKNYYITIEEGGILNLPFPCQLQISAGVQFK